MAPPISLRQPLDTEIQFLKGVGPKAAEVLAKLGLKTVRDVLYYVPRRYEDRTNTPAIASVRPGQWVTIRGRVHNVDARPTSRGMVLIRVQITDGRGAITLVWFNQPWIKKKLIDYKGDIIAYGLVKEGAYAYEIHSPEFELMEEDGDPEAFAKIVPVYGLSEGVPQKLVRRAVASALDRYLEAVPEPFSKGLLRKYDLRPITWCLKEIHHPTSDENRLAARRRLVFEEFFYLQVALEKRRIGAQFEPGISFTWDEGQIREDMAKILPFTLTRAQERVINEVWSDMRKPSPMSRLVQGDVGSGKTAVAAVTMLAAVRSGYQCALMAPTEILAEQHYVNLSRLFEPLGISVTLHVGKLSAAEKRKAIERTQSGKSHIAVGTHALIQEGVEFENLGLVVIDEQHRFGVLQRAALRAKGMQNPDLLVMTATPIPRTLTMAVFGDLDLSVIDELPPGRKPIKTHWKQRHERDAVYEGIRELVREGAQVYVVCPMVGENEKIMAQAAEDLHQRLQSGVLSSFRVGLLHGQMKASDKERIMLQFRDKELDVLVSTTVIEVGVDVPNATTMVIEDANRFGLSQLHQLRGRVGRGSQQSYCILIADAKSEDAELRMQTMVDTTDGFKIAETDLRLRGPGEVAGVRQSGNLDFKIADLIQDSILLEAAREAAEILIKSDPELRRPENFLIKEGADARSIKLISVTKT